ncbi:hypothetical protein WJX73_008182 [Symbiochloris irregularis]|uniref:Uncharacterized protein n=1 Tax=Symbiochloris irregularis TaxID=706552 RepID=A0AAW1PQX3_9CHLO
MGLQRDILGSIRKVTRQKDCKSKPVQEARQSALFDVHYNLASDLLQQVDYFLGVPENKALHLTQSHMPSLQALRQLEARLHPARCLCLAEITKLRCQEGAVPAVQGSYLGSRRTPAAMAIMWITAVWSGTNTHSRTLKTLGWKP